MGLPQSCLQQELRAALESVPRQRLRASRQHLEARVCMIRSATDKGCDMRPEQTGSVLGNRQIRRDRRVFPPLFTHPPYGSSAPHSCIPRPVEECDPHDDWRTRAELTFC